MFSAVSCQIHLIGTIKIPSLTNNLALWSASTSDWVEHIYFSAYIYGAMKWMVLHLPLFLGITCLTLDLPVHSQKFLLWSWSLQKCSISFMLAFCTCWSDPKPWSHWWAKVTSVCNSYTIGVNSYTILYRGEFYPLHEMWYIWQITFTLFFEKCCIMSNHAILIPCYSYFSNDYLECLHGTFLFTDFLWEIPSRPTSIRGVIFPHSLEMGWKTFGGSYRHWSSVSGS